MEKLVSFLESLSKGTFGICMLTCTEPKMRKTNNKYYGDVKKITYTANVALGYDYVAYLVGKAKKQGISLDINEVRSQVSKPKGKEWFKNPYILQSDKNAAQRYLRCYYNSNTKPKSIYVYKGKIVTDKVMLEEIKSFIQTSSSKSTKFGSEVEDIVLRDYKLENVVLLKQGSKEYNLMEHLFSAEQILEFIKSLL